VTTIKEKLVEIGAKVVGRARSVAFQMAKVAISKNLFAEILRMIAELRPPPEAPRHSSLSSPLARSRTPSPAPAPGSPLFCWRQENGGAGVHCHGQRRGLGRDSGRAFRRGRRRHRRYGYHRNRHARQVPQHRRLRPEIRRLHQYLGRYQLRRQFRRRHRVAGPALQPRRLQRSGNLLGLLPNLITTNEPAAGWFSLSITWLAPAVLQDAGFAGAVDTSMAMDQAGFSYAHQLFLLLGGAPYFIDYAATMWLISDQKSLDTFEAGLNRAFGSGSPNDTS